MSKLRILYVASEINPFLQTSDVADFVRKLPQAMQEKGMEIRILVPRFGIINERKNRLHEVVRLSGINIAVGDEEKPLIIKVASIPNAKLQVYFIDNEDYFHRKSVFHDKENNFYEDNDERAIFFCKGVIETVRKLGWAPDIVHCNDWITSFIPLYLKTTYKNDPLFKNAKTVFSIYNNSFSHKFKGDIMGKVKMMDIEDNMLGNLKTADFEGARSEATRRDMSRRGSGNLVRQRGHAVAPRSVRAASASTRSPARIRAMLARVTFCRPDQAGMLLTSSTVGRPSGS
jgi:starch synthase